MCFPSSPPSSWLFRAGGVMVKFGCAHTSNNGARFWLCIRVTHTQLCNSAAVAAADNSRNVGATPLLLRTLRRERERRNPPASPSPSPRRRKSIDRSRCAHTHRDGWCCVHLCVRAVLSLSCYRLHVVFIISVTHPLFSLRGAFVIHYR